MIITFKSNVGGDVIMFETDGKQILGVLGKNPDDIKGVITAEQLPDAISAIKTAINGDKAIQREPMEDDNETSNPVYLFQRASPILELLERSLKENEPVTWGV